MELMLRHDGQGQQINHVHVCGSKVKMKCDQRKVLICLLIVDIDRERSMIGREFQSLITRFKLKKVGRIN